MKLLAYCLRILLTASLTLAALPGAELKGVAPAKSDLCVPPPGAAAPTLPAKLLQGQGTVHFPITTSNSEAQAFFDQGIAQMHSFWAREAERSFLQAAALDTAAPMPWFGVAMVAAGDWRPRFQVDTAEEMELKKPNGKSRTGSRAVDAAKKALELSQVPGSATDLERMYIAAIGARRDSHEAQPIDAFIRKLREIVAKYPAEVEAKSYLALMLMRGFTQPDKKARTPGSMEAVAILKDLVLIAPEHPGVHHYIIHGFEGSEFAKDAWPSCRRYAELVPNIPHALHMPGHIYSQTGKWDLAIQSFSTAAENERRYIDGDTLYGTGHHAHNVHYLATAYAFHGDYEGATNAARGLMTFKENPRERRDIDNLYTAYCQGWFALMGAMVQFEKWNEILDESALPPAQKPALVAWHHWAKALAHLSSGHIAEGKLEAKLMSKAISDLKTKSEFRTPASLPVGREELKAHLAAAQGKNAAALRIMTESAARERRLRYSEPPQYPRPINEALGRMANTMGKRDIAEKAYKAALEQYPSDSHAEAGLKALLAVPAPATREGL